MKNIPADVGKKVALWDNRLKIIDNGKVLFKVNGYSYNKCNQLNPQAVEMMRRFMLHVLLCEFFKIEWYSILNSRKQIEALERCRDFHNKL